MRSPPASNASPEAGRHVCVANAQSFITLTYLIETPGDPERLAQKIASDQSTGTFVPVPGETEELKNRVAARVVAMRNSAAGAHTVLSVR